MYQCLKVHEGSFRDSQQQNENKHPNMSALNWQREAVISSDYIQK